MNNEFPPVLDVCCGPRMMWFEKQDKRALFHDRRDVDIETKPNAAYKNGKVFSIRPDVCGSFAALQFPDNTFSHVVFDPPHFVETDPNSKMLMRVQYGQLADGWKDEIRIGFSECFRVLKPQGTLVFKWCEYDVPVSDVLALTQEKPLYGHRSGKQSKTHWLVFMKPNEKISRRCKRSAGLNCWTLFFPIFEFQVFNSCKFVCIIGNKDESARNCLSCDEHVVRADKISFFF